MKFLFIVQGEGRGHLTQAITLSAMLRTNGHQVVGVMVGKNNFRELPAFFAENIHAPVFRFKSPNFLPGAKKKHPDIAKTFIYNMLKAPEYYQSILLIRRKIESLEADVVINFYEMLVGLTYAILPPKIPYVCIAHQYILLHPDFEFPRNENMMAKFLLKFFTRITCINADKLLALSFRKMENIAKQKMVVVPPLLRKEILMTTPSAGKYLHGYMLNDAYAEEVIQFNNQRPEIEMHFFWDKKKADETTPISKTLTFHRLNDKLFIRYMASCVAYATTAGFESVCEAMYLGKPVLMVPTHIEQACNAHDAELSGAGITSYHFDLQALLDFIPYYDNSQSSFRQWVLESEACIIRELTKIPKLTVEPKVPVKTSLEDIPMHN